MTFDRDATQSCWTAKRAVEGITIHFKDPLNCAPVVEPPRKKLKVTDETQGAAGATLTSSSSGAAASDLSHDASPALLAASGDRSDGTGAAGDSGSKDVETATPLMNGEWSGSISFIEWRNEVALHVVGYTPVVMVGVQARRLALAAMKLSADAAAADERQEDEKLFNEFVSWIAPDGHKPISPQLHFARDHSRCSVFPVKSDIGMRQEYSLTTKEISGGLRLASFPVPVCALSVAPARVKQLRGWSDALAVVACAQLSNASAATFANVLQICGHSLFFHSVLLSAFCSKNNTFGRRIPADSDDAVNGARATISRSPCVLLTRLCIAHILTPTSV